MVYAYSDERRATDKWSLPNIRMWQATAIEVAETMEDEIHEFMKRREFRLANMNSRDRERLLDAMVEELGITGGWMFAFGFPGCLDDSQAFGPYQTKDEALAEARAMAGDDEEEGDDAT